MRRIEKWRALGLMTVVVGLASILLYHSVIASLIYWFGRGGFGLLQCIYKLNANTCQTVIGALSDWIPERTSGMYLSTAQSAWLLVISDASIQILGLIGWLTPFTHNAFLKFAFSKLTFLKVASPLGLLRRITSPWIGDLLTVTSVAPTAIVENWGYTEHTQPVIAALQETAVSLETFAFLVGVFFVLWVVVIVTWVLDRRTSRAKDL